MLRGRICETQKILNEFIQLGMGRTAKQIATGSIHTCAILNDNSVKCWGYNGNGQLGYGDTRNRNSPPANSINLGEGQTAKQIAAGGFHTCAILNDNSVKCWGYNGNGRLGYGDTTHRNFPPANSINLEEGQTAKQIAAGGFHTCAILNDNSVKCWGYNGNGQLGYGDTRNRNSPPANSINLGEGQTAKQIIAGNSHTCAIVSDDSVKCWGNNRNGQLGYGGY